MSLIFRKNEIFHQNVQLGIGPFVTKLISPVIDDMFFKKFQSWGEVGGCKKVDGVKNCKIQWKLGMSHARSDLMIPILYKYLSSSSPGNQFAKNWPLFLKGVEWRT